MSRIYVAGHQGMVGSAVVRYYQARGRERDLIVRDRQQLDLMRQADVEAFLAQEKPDIVILAAAKVGGIHANNTQRADFIRDNLSIALNVIEGARLAGVPRLLNLGSTCIYPREAPQPMPEESLLTGPLESTNEPYAIAKIAALKLCESYRRQYGLLYHSAMPTNLYGPGDNYHPENSHVLPALIRRFHEARENHLSEVVIWGTGSPRREFLYVDDLAAAIDHLLQLTDPPDWVNVGTGEDLSIAELAAMVARVVGYSGELVFDSLRPDGTPRKLTTIERLRATGWAPVTPLEEGIRLAYADFLDRLSRGSARL